MHINVSHILAGEVGASASFPLTGENPNIPDLELVQPLTGQVTLTNLGDKLRLTGVVGLVFRLECYRCLDTFEHQANISLEGLFNQRPVEGEWPISARGEINLQPLLREEALVNIPVQQLCVEDCQGLCAECGQRQTAGHKHKTELVTHKPRIKKGQ